MASTCVGRDSTNLFQLFPPQPGVSLAVQTLSARGRSCRQPHRLIVLDALFITVIKFLCLLCGSGLAGPVVTYLVPFGFSCSSGTNGMKPRSTAPSKRHKATPLSLPRLALCSTAIAIIKSFVFNQSRLLGIDSVVASLLVQRRARRTVAATDVLCDKRRHFEKRRLPFASRGRGEGRVLLNLPHWVQLFRSRVGSTWSRRAKPLTGQCVRRPRVRARQQRYIFSRRRLNVRRRAFRRAALTKGGPPPPTPSGISLTPSLSCEPLQNTSTIHTARSPEQLPPV